MIELTQDQVHALAMPGAGPPRVVNPQTQEMFVLVPLAEYGRLVHEEGWPVETFQHWLADLLKRACLP